MDDDQMFDFDAFVEDACRRSDNAQLPALQRSNSETTVTTHDPIFGATQMQAFISHPPHPSAHTYDAPSNASSVNTWAPWQAPAPMAMQPQPPLSPQGNASAQTDTGPSSPSSSRYTAGLVAHHSVQLNRWLPEQGTSPGTTESAPKRSFGGASSNGQISQQELTIQERRKISRRKTNEALKSTPAYDREEAKRQRVHETLVDTQAAKDAYSHVVSTQVASTSRTGPAMAFDVAPQHEQASQAHLESCSENDVIMAEELTKIIGSGSDETAQWAGMLLENSHDLIHVLSLKGTFLYVSLSVERLLGYKPEELVGRSITNFCHPADVVPVFRELKDSTSNTSIAAAARRSACNDGTVNPITKGGAGQSGPQVNLLMRMRHKTLGYAWIESVGKLHLEQGKGRKVVVFSARARPVDDLQWESARNSLIVEQPSFWSKVSLDGLLLSVSGPVAEVLGSGADDARMSGHHVRQLVNKEAHSAVLASLRSPDMSTVSHTMSGGSGGAPVEVISTFHPSHAASSITHDQNTVFVHTQRSDAASLSAGSSMRAAEVSHVSSPVKANAPSSGSVFAELSTYRSSSWLFELAQLKNANRRLREEVRQRSASDDVGLARRLDASLRSVFRVEEEQNPPAPAPAEAYTPTLPMHAGSKRARA